MNYYYPAFLSNNQGKERTHDWSSNAEGAQSHTCKLSKRSVARILCVLTIQILTKLTSVNSVLITLRQYHRDRDSV